MKIVLLNSVHFFFLKSINASISKENTMAGVSGFISTFLKFITNPGQVIMLSTTTHCNQCQHYEKGTSLFFFSLSLHLPSLLLKEQCALHARTNRCKTWACSVKNCSCSVSLFRKFSINFTKARCIFLKCRKIDALFKQFYWRLPISGQFQT